MSALSAGMSRPGEMIVLLFATLLLATTTVTRAAPVYDQDTTEVAEYEGDASGCYYNFQRYQEGDRIITNEPCLNCTCHNRMLMCYLRVCPFTKAIGQDCTVEKRPDQCCPIITCPEVPVQLLTSTTNSPATIGSTEIGAHDNYGCNVENRFYADGAQLPIDPRNPCELCYCIRNRTTCVMQECTLRVAGCQPVYLSGVCCPVKYNCDYDEEQTTDVGPTTPGLIMTTTVAPGSSVPQCYHSDRYYESGELIYTPQPCKHCYCFRGNIVCAVQNCGVPMENQGKNCTALPTPEGKCCPDTYQCEGDEGLTKVSTDERAPVFDGDLFKPEHSPGSVQVTESGIPPQSSEDDEQQQHQQTADAFPGADNTIPERHGDHDDRVEGTIEQEPTHHEENAPQPEKPIEENAVPEYVPTEVPSGTTTGIRADENPTESVAGEPEDETKHEEPVEAPADHNDVEDTTQTKPTEAGPQHTVRIDETHPLVPSEAESSTAPDAHETETQTPVAVGQVEDEASTSVEGTVEEHEPTEGSGGYAYDVPTDGAKLDEEQAPAVPTIATTHETHEGTDEEKPTAELDEDQKTEVPADETQRPTDGTIVEEPQTPLAPIDSEQHEGETPITEGMPVESATGAEELPVEKATEAGVVEEETTKESGDVATESVTLKGVEPEEKPIGQPEEGVHEGSKHTVAPHEVEPEAPVKKVDTPEDILQTKPEEDTTQISGESTESGIVDSEPTVETATSEEQTGHAEATQATVVPGEKDEYPDIKIVTAEEQQTDSPVADEEDSKKTDEEPIISVEVPEIPSVEKPGQPEEASKVEQPVEPHDHIVDQEFGIPTQGPAGITPVDDRVPVVKAEDEAIEVMHVTEIHPDIGQGHIPDSLILEGHDKPHPTYIPPADSTTGSEIAPEQEVTEVEGHVKAPHDEEAPVVTETSYESATEEEIPSKHVTAEDATTVAAPSKESTPELKPTEHGDDEQHVTGGPVIEEARPTEGSVHDVAVPESGHTDVIPTDLSVPTESAPSSSHESTDHPVETEQHQIPVEEHVPSIPATEVEHEPTEVSVDVGATEKDVQQETEGPVTHVETPVVPSVPDEKPIEQSHETVHPTDDLSVTSVAEESTSEAPVAGEKSTESSTSDENRTDVPVAEGSPTEVATSPEELPASAIPEQQPHDGSIAEEKPTETSVDEQKPTEIPVVKGAVTVGPAEDSSTDVAQEEKVTVIPEKKLSDIPEQKPADIPEAKPSDIPEDEVTPSDAIVPDEKVTETTVDEHKPEDEAIIKVHPTDAAISVEDITGAAITDETPVGVPVTEVESAEEPETHKGDEEPSKIPGQQEDETGTPVSIDTEHPSEGGAAHEEPVEPTGEHETPAEPSVSEEQPTDGASPDEKTTVSSISDEEPTESSDSEKKPTESSISEGIPTTESVAEEQSTELTPEKKLPGVPAVEEHPTESSVSELVPTVAGTIEQGTAETPADEQKTEKPFHAEEQSTEGGDLTVPESEHKLGEPLVPEDKPVEPVIEEQQPTLSSVTEKEDSAVEHESTEPAVSAEEATKVPVAEEESTKVSEAEGESTEASLDVKNIPESPIAPAEEEKPVESKPVDESQVHVEEPIEPSVHENVPTQASAVEDEATQASMDKQEPTEISATEVSPTKSSVHEEVPTKTPIADDEPLETAAPVVDEVTGVPHEEVQPTASPGAEESTAAHIGDEPLDEKKPSDGLTKIDAQHPVEEQRPIDEPIPVDEQTPTDEHRPVDVHKPVNEHKLDEEHKPVDEQVPVVVQTPVDDEKQAGEEKLPTHDGKPTDDQIPIEEQKPIDEQPPGGGHKFIEGVRPVDEEGKPIGEHVPIDEHRPVDGAIDQHKEHEGEQSSDDQKPIDEHVPSEERPIDEHKTVETETPIDEHETSEKEKPVEEHKPLEEEQPTDGQTKHEGQEPVEEGKPVTEEERVEEQKPVDGTIVEDHGVTQATTGENELTETSAIDQQPIVIPTEGVSEVSTDEEKPSEPSVVHELPETSAIDEKTTVEGGIPTESEEHGTAKPTHDEEQPVDGSVPESKPTDASIDEQKPTDVPLVDIKPEEQLPTEAAHPDQEPTKTIVPEGGAAETERPLLPSGDNQSPAETPIEAQKPVEEEQKPVEEEHLPSFEDHDEGEREDGHFPATIPGEGNCLVDGRSYSNNSNIPPANLCQLRCVCISSIVHCDLVDCPPPPAHLSNCMPIHSKSESCCPTYSCDSTPTSELESDSQITDGQAPEHHAIIPQPEEAPGKTGEEQTMVPVTSVEHHEHEPQAPIDKESVEPYDAQTDAPSGPVSSEESTTGIGGVKIDGPIEQETSAPVASDSDKAGSLDTNEIPEQHVTEVIDQNAIPEVVTHAVHPIDEQTETAVPSTEISIESEAHTAETPIVHVAPVESAEDEEKHVESSESPIPVEATEGEATPVVPVEENAVTESQSIDEQPSTSVGTADGHTDAPTVPESEQSGEPVEAAVDHTAGPAIVVEEGATGSPDTGKPVVEIETGIPQTAIPETETTGAEEHTLSTLPEVPAEGQTSEPHEGAADTPEHIPGTVEPIVEDTTGLAEHTELPSDVAHPDHTPLSESKPDESATEHSLEPVTESHETTSAPVQPIESGTEADVEQGVVKHGEIPTSGEPEHIPEGQSTESALPIEPSDLRPTGEAAVPVQTSEPGSVDEAEIPTRVVGSEDNAVPAVAPEHPEEGSTSLPTATEVEQHAEQGVSEIPSELDLATKTPTPAAGLDEHAASVDGSTIPSFQQDVNEPTVASVEEQSVISGEGATAGPADAETTDSHVGTQESVVPTDQSPTDADVRGDAEVTASIPTEPETPVTVAEETSGLPSESPKITEPTVNTEEQPITAEGPTESETDDNAGPAIEQQTVLPVSHDDAEAPEPTAIVKEAAPGTQRPIDDSVEQEGIQTPEKTTSTLEAVTEHATGPVEEDETKTTVPDAKIENGSTPIAESATVAVLSEHTETSAPTVIEDDQTVESVEPTAGPVPHDDGQVATPSETPQEHPDTTAEIPAGSVSSDHAEPTLPTVTEVGEIVVVAGTTPTPIGEQELEQIPVKAIVPESETAKPTDGVEAHIDESAAPTDVPEPAQTPETPEDTVGPVKTLEPTAGLPSNDIPESPAPTVDVEDQAITTEEAQHIVPDHGQTTVSGQDDVLEGQHPTSIPASHDKPEAEEPSSVSGAQEPIVPVHEHASGLPEDAHVPAVSTEDKEAAVEISTIGHVASGETETATASETAEDHTIEIDTVTGEPVSPVDTKTPVSVSDDGNDIPVIVSTPEEPLSQPEAETPTPTVAVHVEADSSEGSTTAESVSTDHAETPVTPVIEKEAMPIDKFDTKEHGELETPVPVVDEEEHAVSAEHPTAGPVPSEESTSGPIVHVEVEGPASTSSPHDQVVEITSVEPTSFDKTETPALTEDEHDVIGEHATSGPVMPQESDTPAPGDLTEDHTVAVDESHKPVEPEITSDLQPSVIPTEGPAHATSDEDVKSATEVLSTDALTEEAEQPVAGPATGISLESSSEAAVPEEPAIVASTPAASEGELTEKPVEHDIVGVKTGEKPTQVEADDQQPISGEHAEERPTESTLVEEKPVEGEPIEVTPVHVEPAEGKPTEGEPTAEEPTEGTLIEEKPIEGEPAEIAPTATEPAEEKPSEGEPEEVRPTESILSEGKPNEAAPTEEKPIEGESVEPKPFENEPAEGTLVPEEPHATDAAIVEEKPVITEQPDLPTSEGATEQELPTVSGPVSTEGGEPQEVQSPEVAAPGIIEPVVDEEHPVAEQRPDHATEDESSQHLVPTIPAPTESGKPIDEDEQQQHVHTPDHSAHEEPEEPTITDAKPIPTVHSELPPSESATSQSVDESTDQDQQQHVDVPDQSVQLPEHHAVDDTEGQLTIGADDHPIKPVDHRVDQAEPTKIPDYYDRPIASTLAPQGTSAYPDQVVTHGDNVHFPVDNGTYLNPDTEDDYDEDDQAIYGPGTCRYNGKVYVSAQQIPRDDPCDFCFCFRSDIICLQQTCPRPIPGCHEEPITGFCCPRYNCPVSMATLLNVTTTTTTTTTTLPPHFLEHAYKGAARRSGCQIRGQAYRVGEAIPSASGPCLQCTCGGDGNMKCEPRVCSPEPMLRQMIAAATAKRRR